MIGKYFVLLPNTSCRPHSILQRCSAMSSVCLSTYIMSTVSPTCTALNKAEGVKSTVIEPFIIFDHMCNDNINATTILSINAFCKGMRNLSMKFVFLQPQHFGTTDTLADYIVVSMPSAANVQLCSHHLILAWRCHYKWSNLQEKINGWTCKVFVHLSLHHWCSRVCSEDHWIMATGLTHFC